MKHQDPQLTAHTRPTGTFVTIRARDDLDPSSDSVKVEHSGRSVTAVPENVGLCEVIAIGPDVTNVQPGDVCFIDFFDVAQGYIVGGGEVYVTQAMALRMTLDIEAEPYVCPYTKKDKLRVLRCDITPLPGYALTKHAPERMTVAVTGCDRLILPRDKTTSGIVGGRDSDGQPSTYVCYEELVKLTPGAIQQERYVENGWTGERHDTYFEERKLKAKIQKLERILHDNGIWTTPRELDDYGCEPGDLVVFCSDFSIQFRAMGEQFRCVPYKNLLAVVDDRAILEAYNKTNPPKPLIHLMGGGAARLYGT